MAQLKAPPPLPEQLRPPWMNVALAEEGVKERIGRFRDHPRIIEYIRSVTRLPLLLRDSTPWCSAFVNWCLREAFPSYHGQRARARAWMTFGTEIAPTMARYGDIVIVERGIPKVGGHVAFFVRNVGPYVELYGGNQKQSVCLALYLREKILAVRRPS